MSVSAFLMSIRIGCWYGGALRVPHDQVLHEQLKLEITQIMNKMLPMEVDKAMPEIPKLPTKTGPAKIAVLVFEVARRPFWC